ncbi:hypothetical protein [Metabacillus litoralis]|uniref:hypothetical protein n=1 Tax=Metabacillus litoralis TaxID=152268 RepID=UPI001CFCF944|nr:hypothetical protein [Metabacillus litoralis]
MKLIIWRVFFVAVFMFSFAIIDYFFDGWMKYVTIGLIGGAIFPHNYIKNRDNKN